MSVAPDSAPEPLLAKSKTARATIAAMEEILGKQIPVLNGQGFLRVVDYMGDDGAIVQAARVSYGQGTKHTSQGPRTHSLSSGPNRPHNHSV